MVPAWFLALLIVPLIMVAVDTAVAMRATVRRTPGEVYPPCHDFAVLVPIYGDIRYLENVGYLARYGSRVVLCTTTGESPQFLADLHAVAAQNGFGVSCTPVARSEGGSGKRATGGVVRDTLIRDALARVEQTHVVCLDADTTTVRPLEDLVGELVARKLDLCSVRLVPSNTERWLGRLQAHEYRISMSVRTIVPWMVSGACHAARTDVHREIMARHSLFFQGNDVEAGLIGHALGYRVGHIVFEVPTTVPDRPRAWLRQRLAWAGGEFRLYAVNVHLIRRHVFLWTYGLGVVLIGTPWRWVSLAHVGRSVIVAAVLYLIAAIVLNRRHLDRWVLVLPLYSGFSAMVLSPIGIVTYVRMAVGARNAGLIRMTPRQVTFAEPVG